MFPMRSRMLRGIGPVTLWTLRATDQAGCRGMMGADAADAADNVDDDTAGKDGETEETCP